MVASAAVRVITVDSVLIVRRWAALAAAAAVSAAVRAEASAAVLPAAAAAEDRFNARKMGNNIFAEFFVFSG